MKHLNVKRIVFFFLFALFSLLCFILGIVSSTPHLPKNGETLLLFSNQCEDDLRKVYLHAILTAKESIVLIIYSMTDRYLINALRKKAEDGVLVTVIHDPKTVQWGFNQLGEKIQRFVKNGSGLMHQKILIIDKSTLLIGSTNLTPTSLIVYDNLVMGCQSKELCQSILGRHHYLKLAPPSQAHHFQIGGQHVEFWSLPDEGKEGLDRLIDLLDQATEKIQVAMFTWTHARLTEAVIQAAKRGVKVEVVIDRNQGSGVSKKTIKALRDGGVLTFLGGSEITHHKMAIIDKTLLIHGSANWTKAAFTRNDDCYVVVHHLKKEQKKKLKKIWRAIKNRRHPLINISHTE
ncbi:MAG: hypothetical protein KDK55_03180 [Chlamydiia bacterium]|nr:hypothetical protein [Chlamydiia bacterium]